MHPILGMVIILAVVLACRSVSIAWRRVHARERFDIAFREEERSPPKVHRDG